MSKTQIAIVGTAAFVVIFFVLVFLGVIPGLSTSNQGQKKATQLNFWGVEKQDNIQPILEGYKTAMAASGANVKINYTQFSENDYEKKLIDALAAGQGPDILMFHNTWLPKHVAKIAPAPASSLPLTQFKNLFPQVVENDFVRGDGANAKIYALPLYIDTLAAIYNRDYFDRKGLATGLATWTDLQNVIPALREADNIGRIIKAPAAIGGSGKSIDRASDLLNLLMLQSGAAINISRYEGSREAYPAEVNLTGDRNVLSALNFYLQFGDSKSPSYSWSDNLTYSLDNFAGGNTALIFNYASSLPLLKKQNPFLNLRVSPMLQFDLNNPINYADYYGLAVSNQSAQAPVAWNFIFYLTANPTVAEQYLQATKRPPALRILIQKYLNDPDLGVFCGQALTAKSWRQKDKAAIRQIFSNMLESVLNGRVDSESALKQAEGAINGL